MNLDILFNYACNRMYHIDYKTYDNYTISIEGLLINYSGSKIVLLSDCGVYQLNYNDICLMRPMRLKEVIGRSCEEYKQVVLKYLNITEETL